MDHSDTQDSMYPMKLKFDSCNLGDWRMSEGFSGRYNWYVWKVLQALKKVVLRLQRGCQNLAQVGTGENSQVMTGLDR